MSAYLAAKRPVTVTLLIWGVILFGGWNGSRVWAWARNRDLWQSHSVWPPPAFQMVMALLWAVGFGVMAWFLVRKRPFTRWAVPGLLALYGAYTLGIRLLFVSGPHTLVGIWVMTLFFLMLVLLSMLILRRAARQAYFSERSEERPNVPSSSR